MQYYYEMLAHTAVRGVGRGTNRKRSKPEVRLGGKR